MKDPLYMEYADYWGMYLQTLENCVQETFEACSTTTAVSQEELNDWLDRINPLYIRKVSAESAIA